MEKTFETRRTGGKVCNERGPWRGQSWNEAILLSGQDSFDRRTFSLHHLFSLHQRGKGERVVGSVQVLGLRFHVEVIHQPCARCGIYLHADCYGDSFVCR